MCLITLYYKKIKDEIICIMKIKGPFIKIVLLNEAVKHFLFKLNFDIGILFDSL
jgi:hypothetical protein